MQSRFNFPRQSGLTTTREPIQARGGMVAAKMPEAAAAGTSILKAGGNAVDAAVATAFAIGVCEPYMSGLGGGGYMVVWLAREKRSLIIDYPMISGSGAHENMFPLAPEGGIGDALLFGWPATVDNANVVGHSSVCVPGTVAGLSLALERYGTMSLAEVLQPAIEIAEDGYAINWHSTLMQASFLTVLRQFPASAEALLAPGAVPYLTFDAANPTKHVQKDLAKTLRTIAEKGPEEFYTGDLAKTIVAELGSNGSSLTAQDFADYRAIEKPSIEIEYHDATVHTIGGGTGGLSVGESLTMLNQLDIAAPGERSAGDYHKMTQAFRQTFADRYSYLADSEAVTVPESALLDPEYARERIATFSPNEAQEPEAGKRERLGVDHELEMSVPDYLGARNTSTTHLSVVDAEGNAVSLTQTLLNLYGSGVVIPGTGIVMNNGMMWFDPEPGKPNSPGPDKRPLSNMAPLVVTKHGELVASLGSSGGRKIQNCNVQVAINMIDGDLSAQDAINEGQIETSTRVLLIAPTIDAEVVAGLKEMGHEVSVRDPSAQTYDFASPVAIRRQADGSLDGGADPWYFPATVMGLEEN